MDVHFVPDYYVLAEDPFSQFMFKILRTSPRENNCTYPVIFSPSNPLKQLTNLGKASRLKMYWKN